MEDQFTVDSDSRNEEIEEILDIFNKETPKKAKMGKGAKAKRAALTSETAKSLRYNLVNKKLYKRAEKYNEHYYDLNVMTDKINEMLSAGAGSRRIKKRVNKKNLNKLAKILSKHGVAIINLENKRAKLEGTPRAIKVNEHVTFYSKVLSALGKVAFVEKRMMKNIIKKEVKGVKKDTKEILKDSDREGRLDVRNLKQENLSDFVISKLQEKYRGAPIDPDDLDDLNSSLEPNEQIDNENQFNFEQQKMDLNQIDLKDVQNEEDLNNYKYKGQTKIRPATIEFIKSNADKWALKSLKEELEAKLARDAAEQARKYSESNPYQFFEDRDKARQEREEATTKLADAQEQERQIAEDLGLDISAIVSASIDLKKASDELKDYLTQNKGSVDPDVIREMAARVADNRERINDLITINQAKIEEPQAKIEEPEAVVDSQPEPDYTYFPEVEKYSIPELASLIDPSLEGKNISENDVANLMKDQKHEEFLKDNPEIEEIYRLRELEIRLRERGSSDNVVNYDNLEANPELAVEWSKLRENSQTRTKNYFQAYEEERKEIAEKLAAENRQRSAEIRERISLREAAAEQAKANQKLAEEANIYRELLKKAGGDYTSVSDVDMVKLFTVGPDNPQEEVSAYLGMLNRNAEYYDSFAETTPKDSYSSEEKWHSAVVSYAKEASENANKGKSR